MARDPSHAGWNFPISVTFDLTLMVVINRIPAVNRMTHNPLTISPFFVLPSFSRSPKRFPVPALRNAQLAKAAGT